MSTAKPVRIIEFMMEEGDDRKVSCDSTTSMDSLSLRRRDLRRASTFTTQCVLTGIVYDERMKAHRNEASDHPERPERLTAIWAQLNEDGVSEACRKIEAREATEEEILYVHSKGHYDKMVATKDMPLEKLFHVALRLNSIYMNPSSVHCALLSAGSVCELTKRVVNEELDNGVAIVRPPGHHAEAYKAMGFCFFNNVAIAAKMAIEKYGLKRILIVDWDVHHGNATQHMFYDDNRVLYVSLHRYDHGGFFPGGDEGDYTRIGEGKGLGHNVNVAWNYAKMGDGEYMSAFHQVIMPIAYEYNPELVLISAGFDSGCGDPLGGYNVSPSGYAQMTHQLKALANGKLVVALEGGYNLSTISNSMSAVIQVLLGDTPNSIENCIPNDSAVTSITNTARILSKYWKSLRHWNPSSDSLLNDSSPAPLTEDSMSEPPPQDSVPQDSEPQDSVPQDKGEEKEGTTTSLSSHNEDPIIGRTEPPEELPPHPETPPPGTMPVPSERMPLNVAQQAIVQQLEVDGNVCMFAVNPLAWCEHLTSIKPFETSTVNTSALCETCNTHRENWICLTCHHVHCGRYINQHMLSHGEETGHTMVLSYSDLSVWCFACDSYVYNPVLFPYIKAASDDKFKEQ